MQISLVFLYIFINDDIVIPQYFQTPRHHPLQLYQLFQQQIRLKKNSTLKSF